jgi:inorganic triphosphatase YgiF
MPTEVEAKFLADGAAALDALARAPKLGEATLDAPATASEIDIYLDTAGGRLGAARWACRLRDRDDGFRISLKGPAEDIVDGWLHRRPEVEGPATASFDPHTWPASEARDLVLELSRGAALIERFRLLQRRTERDVRFGSERLGTLSLDVATIAREGEQLGVLHVVELELASADDAASAERLDALASVLARQPGLRADPRSKLEHAMELLAPG